MLCTLSRLAGVCLLGLIFLSRPAFAASFASGVVSYNQGTTPSPGYTDPSTALGSPERFTGEIFSFPANVQPFSPPFSTDELVSIGEGGHLTLRLSNYAIPQAGPEIGVFTNAGIADADGDFGNANAQAGATLSPLDFSTFGIDSATVEVSEDGLFWVSLGTTLFDIPTNGYLDLTDVTSTTPGSVPSDFSQPFTGTLADFAGRKYFDGVNPSVLDLLAGSGGGKWIDISGSGLSQVGFIRFSVGDDGNPLTELNFELDGVSLALGAIGGIVPVPEPSSWLLGLLAVAIGIGGVVLKLRGRSRP